MCGIVGYTGDQNCVPILMNGLTSLAYRGYDSAGVAIWEGSELTLRKAKGKIENLKNLLEESPVSGKSGIGHTRWATHGEPSDINAHPHTDTHKTRSLPGRRSICERSNSSPLSSAETRMARTRLCAPVGSDATRQNTASKLPAKGLRALRAPAWLLFFIVISGQFPRKRQNTIKRMQGDSI